MERFHSEINIQRDWSDLPGDVLGLISLRLSLFDLFSFIWVCSSWQVAAKAICKGKSFPVLVLSDALQPKGRKGSQIDDVSLLSDREVSPSTHKKTRDRINLNIKHIGKTVSFFSIKHKQEYSLRDPQNLCSNFSEIVGSHPDGWLVMLDEFQHPYLLKLLPQIQRIQLPKILLLPNGKSIKYKWCTKAVMSVSNPSNHQHDPIMVIMRYNFRMLAFWRYGANEWTGLEGLGYYDIAFCNNTLYTLQVVGRVFDVFLVKGWEFSTISSCLPETKFSFEMSGLTGSMIRGECYNQDMRLMVSPVNNEILVLYYGGRCVDDPNQKWSIFKLDLGEGRCIQMNSLNGQALLLDRCSSIFVPSNDVEHHGFKPNSIYYVSWWERNRDIKLRNCGIEDGEIQHIWDSRADSYIGSCWIAPTF